MGLQHSPQWPTWIETVAAVLVSCAGVSVLLACTADLPALKRIVPGWTAMAPGAAACFVLAGMALGARVGKPVHSDTPLARRVSQAAAAAFALIGALIFITVWVRLKGQRAGLDGTGTGASLFAFSIVLVFAALIWANAARLHHAKTADDAIARDITARKREAGRLQTQLSRLDLLNRITQAINQGLDIESIYQVVIRNLEDELPVEFSCVCLYDNVENAFVVSFVGVKSNELALALAEPERFHIPIDQNGLSRCLEGELMYEADLGAITHPFSDRLAEGGLRSMVISPLSVDSEVFGVLVVARRETNGFGGGECDFLRQLSAHTALAARQSQLHRALQCAYEDLRQTQQAAKQHERLYALGEMASGVAHDINNGLSPILLYTASLLEHEKNLSAVARENLKIVHRAGSDISSTIGRLHEFYQRHEPQLILEPVQLNSLSAQVVTLTRARWHDVAQQRGIEIEMRMDLSQGLPLILGVESEIREALVNLVLNSVDALPRGGRITLRTTASASTVTVQVADTGSGMDEDTRRRCLEPFFTTKGERGTGLGLAMVYGIIKRHNGDINIDSEPGKGATVSMAFPIASRRASEPAPLFSEARPLPRLRLLVVDDNPLILKAIHDSLEGDGHIVVSANGGQAGIDAFKSAFLRYQPFSAVITDLGMPYLDGRAVAGAIKAISPMTPVILLTGWGRRMKAEGDTPAHVDSVLGKPPKTGELREALARHFSVN